jgi:hypothetical protein
MRKKADKKTDKTIMKYGKLSHQAAWKRNWIPAMGV